MDTLQAYKILGLAGGASEDEVKHAYRELAKKYDVESYEAGPLRAEAESKMQEINDAFDALMSYLRTGSTSVGDAPATGTRPASSGSYPEIRRLINMGEADKALAELSAILGGQNDAEWNFLMGSAYYHKGWLSQALMFFQQAVNLDPANREYQAALRNLQTNSQGNMPNSPFTGQDQSAAAMNCACNTCTLMCCMDACCSGCR